MCSQDGSEQPGGNEEDLGLPLWEEEGGDKGANPLPVSAKESAVGDVLQAADDTMAGKPVKPAQEASAAVNFLKTGYSGEDFTYGVNLDTGETYRIRVKGPRGYIRAIINPTELKRILDGDEYLQNMKRLYNLSNGDRRAILSEALLAQKGKRLEELEEKLKIIKSEISEIRSEVANPKGCAKQHIANEIHKRVKELTLDMISKRRRNLQAGLRRMYGTWTKRSARPEIADGANPSTEQGNETDQERK